MPSKKAPLTRSQNMSRIRSADTKPEMLLRRALWQAGRRYRVRYKIGRIKPDVVYVGAKVAVFVDGCQWHGCPDHYVFPRSRRDFWGAKLLENADRDTRQTRSLREDGWRVYRVWEHAVFTELDRVVGEICEVLDSAETSQSDHWHVYQVDVLDAETDLERRYLRLIDQPDTKKTIDRIRSTKKW